MKYLTTLIFFMVLAFYSTETHAQKIKTKKGITYIDDVPYLKISGASGVENQPVKFVCHKTDELFLVFTLRSYTVNGKANWYGEVRFADYELSYNTNSIYIKSLIKDLYDNKILTLDGKFEKETLEKHIRMYHFTPPESN